MVAYPLPLDSSIPPAGSPVETGSPDTNQTSDLAATIWSSGYWDDTAWTQNSAFLNPYSLNNDFINWTPASEVMGGLATDADTTGRGTPQPGEVSSDQFRQALSGAKSFRLTTADQDATNKVVPDYILGTDGKLRRNPDKRAPNQDGSVNVEVQGIEQTNQGIADALKQANENQKSWAREMIQYWINSPEHQGEPIPPEWQHILSSAPDLPDLPDANQSASADTVIPDDTPQNVIDGETQPPQLDNSSSTPIPPPSFDGSGAGGGYSSSGAGGGYSGSGAGGGYSSSGAGGGYSRVGTDTPPPTTDYSDPGRGSPSFDGVVMDKGNPNDFFICQFLDPKFNPNGPPSSQDCGPASLAMIAKFYGVAFDDIGTGNRVNSQTSDPNTLVHAVRGLMTGDNYSSGGTNVGQVENAAQAMGFQTAMVNNIADLDQQLADGHMVVLSGNPRDYQRDLGLSYGKGGTIYDGGHFITVVGRQGDDYVVNDPASHGGSMLLTRRQMEGYINNQGEAQGIGTAVFK